MLKFFRMRWLLNRLFNRYTGWTIFWFIALGLMAFMVNVLGIRLAGDVHHWSAWIKNHALVFLLWRLVLYGSVAYGWWWMRKRVLARDEDPQTRDRFIRIEVSAVVTLLVLEISHWFA
ncbi:MAG: hypothetical protein ACRCWR_12320 [Saezia sp.]